MSAFGFVTGPRVLNSTRRASLLAVLSVTAALAMGGAASAQSPEIVTLKFGTSSAIDFDDVPVFAAFDALQAKGIDVDVLPLANNAATLAALANGQIDFGVARPEAVMRANAAGADLRIFFGRGLSDFVIVAPVSITSPEELDGKRIAYHAPGEITYALAQYLQGAFDIEPEYLVIAGSENRVAAMRAGELDASPVDIASFLALDREVPGEFHILVDFNQAMPGTITTSHVAATAESLSSDPETWKVVAAEMLASLNLAATDPEWLADQAVRYLPGVDREEMLETAQAYASTFDTTGGVDPDQLATMIDFFVEWGIMTEDEVLPFEEYASRVALDQ